VRSRRVSLRSLAHHGFLVLPILFVGVFLVLPLGLTFAISFWERVGLRIRPGFTFAAYSAFLEGTRLTVLERSLAVAVEATALSLLLAYPIAYFLAFKARGRAVRIVLTLFTVPFLINYVIRTFAWTYLFGRTGPVNAALLALDIADRPLDWLLFSDFAVFVGLITSYMPFMIFPLWLSLGGIDRRLVEASWMLGARPWRTFLRVTLPLSLPGVFAAVIFGLVGSFGESAVPIILGGVGYQLMGNTITSAMDVLNYPLAAAMSSIVVVAMLIALAAWFLTFDLRSFLGKALAWRA
jgi:ABC-type spermidine/putrescine transport system permease subunit I